MTKGGEQEMEATVEQTENVENMATPKKKPQKKKTTGKSRSYKPYVFRVKTPRKPKTRKSKK